MAVAATCAYALAISPAFRPMPAEPALLGDPFNRRVRFVTSLVAALTIVGGVVIHRPRVVVPWLLLVGAALLTALGTWDPVWARVYPMWDAWMLPILTISLHLCWIAALVLFNRARGLRRVAPANIDAWIIAALSAVFVVNVTVLPILADPPKLPWAVAAIAAPALAGVRLVLLARLAFVDSIRGFSAALVTVAGLATIAEIAVYRVHWFSNDYYRAVVAPTDTLTYGLLAAAALAPSMHALGEPSPRAAGEWGWRRTGVLVAASWLPILAVIVRTPTGDAEVITVLALVAAAGGLFVVRAQRTVAALADAERHQAQLAATDSTTGLLNRRGLEAVLAADPQRRYALAFVDIDGFKRINDLHGHTAGDRVLASVAARLRSVTDPRHALARVGGDEFAVLIDTTSADQPLGDVLGVAGVIVEAVHEPARVGMGGSGARAVGVTASVGVTVESAAINADPDERVRELLREADIAQYQVKQGGGDGVARFDESLAEQLLRDEDIRNALRGRDPTSRMWVAYQAIVDLESGATTGAEALARMSTERLGEIAPDEFIPVAEATGAIHRLGNKMFAIVADDTESCHRVGTPLRVSVNVSPVQLQSDDFITAMLDFAATRPTLLPSMLLEVTESGLIDGQAVRRLRTLHDVGFALAIDDFGSEYASLQNLAHNMFSVLKIDKSLVRDIAIDSTRHRIVAQIVSLADALGVDTVAEGVEDQAAADALAELGCRYAQGYLYDCPRAGLDRLVLGLTTSR